VIRPTGRLVALAVGLSLLAVGCGEEIQVAEDDPLRAGAELFQERCSGCHTLDAAGSRGSKPEGEVESGERTNGPNFNTRDVSREDALFAIRNGGFSGAIMPANIVVGDEARAVVDFLDEYAGQEPAE
jgi:mono/diheme cytochrome c family protein